MDLAYVLFRQCQHDCIRADPQSSGGFWKGMWRFDFQWLTTEEIQCGAFSLFLSL